MGYTQREVRVSEGWDRKMGRYRLGGRSGLFHTKKNVSYLLLPFFSFDEKVNNALWLAGCKVSAVFLPHKSGHFKSFPARMH